MTNRTWLFGSLLALGCAACTASPTPPPTEPATPPTPVAHEPPPDAGPMEPATQPIGPLDDAGAELELPNDDNGSRCPVLLAGVAMAVDDAPNGISMTFRTNGDDEDEARVRLAARRWYEDLRATRAASPPEPRVRARVEYSEAPGGAVIMFVPRDLAQLERLRAEVREHEDEMSRARTCPVGPPAGIELARL